MQYSNSNYKPENYKYIGKNTPRKEAKDIVTGKTVFLNDFSVPRMLIGATLRSPYAHARITRIDTTEAKKLNGVAAVLTYKDVNQDFKMGMPPSKPVLSEIVMYVGDLVALVAAETKEIAEAALDLIEVEYEELPSVLSGVDALKDDAPQLSPLFDHNIVTPGCPPLQPDGPFWHLIRGDVEKGFEECAYIAEDQVDFDKMPAPAPPEPAGVIAEWTGGHDFKLYTDSQCPYTCKLMSALVMPGYNFVVEAFNVGGSYGNKQLITVQVMSAVFLAQATGRPVKVYQDKVEQMTAYETRLGSQVHAKIGMDKEGIVRAVKAKWVVDAGCLSNATQGQIGVGIGEAQLVMAKCRNWDLDTDLVLTNKQPAGVVRGYGGQELNSCLALLMNRTMQAGGFDPVECFKKNYAAEGDDYYWRDGRLWTAHGINYVPAIEAAAEKFGWKDKWKGWGVPTWVSEDGKIARGVGAGFIGNADVGEDVSEAYVRIVPDFAGDGCHVIVQCSIPESGQGQHTNSLKCVAEVLNVPFDKIDITPNSTFLNPPSWGLAGSRGTVTYGHALSLAAEDARQQLFKLAEPILELSPDGMVLRDYGVSSKAQPEKFVPWKKLIFQDCSLVGIGTHLPDFSTPNFCMSMVEVEVNKETGQVKVLHMLNGTDAGQIMDPATLEMQLQGGIGSACLDTALYEEHIIDPAIKRTMTYNMIEYKWRPFNEFPEFDTSILESQFDTFQFHAVGLGEISGASAASATLAAISNAIGVQVATYPATPDVILRALGKTK